MRQLLTSLSLCFIIFFSGIFSLQAQSYKWVKGGGTTEDLSSALYDEEVDHMCTDANGNIYTIGIVGNNPIIADTFYRPTGAYGGNNNIFVTSYNCAGQMRWAKLIASADNTMEYGIVADNLGHIYISGNFVHVGASHTLHVGYDTTIVANPYIATGIIQFDTSGHFSWIRFLGVNTTSCLTALGSLNDPLVMDGSNNVHFICNTKPGGYLTPTVSTTHYGIYDVVFDVTGTLLSATKLQQDSTLETDGATIDKVSGKLYVYGTRNSDFMGGSSPMSYHPYIASFDVARNLIWTDTLSNPSLPGAVAFSGIVADGIGHLYLTCGGSGEVVYHTDTSLNTLSTIGYEISVVMKLDTTGNLRWKRVYSATTDINDLISITLMPNNKIACAGSMAGMIACGTDTITNYSGEGHNCYFTILDSAGYVHTIQQIHGSGFYDDAYAITSDNVGNLYIGGAIASNVWGGTLTPYTSVGGNTDYFIIKYGMDCSCTSMPVANYTETGGITRSFTYTGTSAYPIDSVRWEFDDGTTSTVTSPTHTYSVAGTFTACVTVYTSCGSDVHCDTFTIPCVAAPTASYSTSGTGLTKTFTYAGSSVGTSGSITWTFGDASAGASGTPVSHTYAAAGTYVVCATATNSCGSNFSCTSVIVTCTTSPVSAYTYSGTGATRGFTYTGTTAGLDSVTWTFGDGGTATGLTPGHTYASPGTYTVCATVHTNCGNNTNCGTIIIICTGPPVASFTYSGTGATISFIYTASTPALDSVRWDFGDGGTSTSIAPGHTFATTGIFHVCVTAYTSCGSNTICHDVTITCITAVAATFTDTGNAVHGFAYSGTPTGLDSVVWEYGDGHKDTGMAALHTYTASGTYHVCVIAYTPCGNDTVCRDVVVLHTSSVTDISLADIHVYPNPATDELYITGISQFTNYRLLTVTGMTLQNGILQRGNNTIMLPSIALGIYIFEMTGNDGQKNIVRLVKE